MAEIAMIVGLVLAVGGGGTWLVARWLLWRVDRRNTDRTSV